MATIHPFPHASLLAQLEHASVAGSCTTVISAYPSLARIPLSAAAVDRLLPLLQARKAVLLAERNTGVVADELRRYQKFAKPGQPTPHIVQLRQQQAAARQASHQAKQGLIKTAAAFVREAGIEVPARVALEQFITSWIDANVPKDVAANG